MKNVLLSILFICILCACCTNGSNNSNKRIKIVETTYIDELGTCYIIQVDSQEFFTTFRGGIIPLKQNK